MYFARTIEASIKPVIHFNRIVTYRSIFFCVKVISSTQQRNTPRFGTIRLKWKTGFNIILYEQHIGTPETQKLR